MEVIEIGKGVSSTYCCVKNGTIVNQIVCDESFIPHALQMTNEHGEHLYDELVRYDHLPKPHPRLFDKYENGKFIFIEEGR